MNARRAAIGAVLIIAWQLVLVAPWAERGASYRLTAATGMDAGVKQFVYFYRYLGLFPIAPSRPPSEFNAAAARALLAEEGDRLKTQVGYYPRHGDRGRIWLYLPHALWTGDTLTARLVPFHGAVFIAALVMLFAASCWAGVPLLGGFLVALIGSHPFQVYETYARENIFGWPVSATVIVLALHLPLLVRSSRLPRWYPAACAVLTALFLGTVREFRTEPVALLVPSLVALATVPGHSRRSRAASIALLVATYLATSVFWQRHFDVRSDDAREIVADAGGRPYLGPNRVHHVFWHSVFCGLGDFAADRGFAWNDSVAYAYAKPILKREHGIDVKAVNPYCYDLRKVPGYAWSPEVPCDVLEVVPAYHQIIRRRVLDEITSDPLWYAGVLARRAVRVFADAPPAHIRAGPVALSIPLSAILVIPVFLAALRFRDWASLKILFFALPVSMTAVAVYSGRGMTHFALFPAVAAALALAWLASWLKRRPWR